MIRPSSFYVNVHSVVFPAGAIRVSSATRTRPARWPADTCATTCEGPGGGDLITERQDGNFVNSDGNVIVCRPVE
jgi:hypothetical protein